MVSVPMMIGKPTSAISDFLIEIEDKEGVRGVSYLIDKL